MQIGTLVLRSIAVATFAFLLLPIVVVVVASLSTSHGLTFPPPGLTLDWYRNIPEEFYAATWVSFVVACSTTLLASIIGTPAALAIVRGRFPGKAALSTICLSPLMVSTLVIGVALFQYAGMLWDAIGFSFAGSIPGLILGHTTFTIPFVIRAAIAGQAHFDASLEDASLSLGATPAQTFFRISLPLLMPGIVSGGIFAFIMSFDDVPIALFLGGGGAVTLPVRIYSFVEFSIDPSIMAIGTIVILASLLLMLAMDRLIGLHAVFGTARG